MNHEKNRPEQELDRHLADFGEWLRAENTVSVYTFAVGQFYGLYPQVNSDTLQLYKCFLLDHYKPRTVNQRIRALNCYMEYRKLPGRPVTMLKMQQKTYVENVISQADYEYLKQCLIRDGNYLYYFLIRFMAATGVRVSELVRIRTIDVENGHLDLYSKGLRRHLFSLRPPRTSEH